MRHAARGGPRTRQAARHGLPDDHRLAQLFPIWEVRNGARARELNLPAAIYIDTHGGIGIGGSDDHAGVDIGRTWSETPDAATPDEFLAHVRAGRVGATHGRSCARLEAVELDLDVLAAAYASADLFLFCSETGTFGQVILEAQASGLPVVAVAAGGLAELIADGRSGVLRLPRVDDLADALATLAGSRPAREALTRGGLAAVAGRSWEASLARLAAGWRQSLMTCAPPAPVAAAPPA